MASKTYNVGIIGYGLSAKIFHIPFINAVPEFRLYAVVQRNPKPEDDAEKDHPGIKSYRSTEEMVKDAGVDVVVVTTTPETHLALAKLALEAGKHVIVEKPFTPTHQEADELAELSKKQNRLISVYQNRRWDADYVTLSKLVKNGSLGRVTEFETHFDRHRPEMPTTGSWKTKPTPGSSAIYDLGTHLIDQVVHLLGLPKRITGFIGSQREKNDSGYEDSFTLLLHYGQTLATVKTTVISPEEKQLRFWVRGDKGSFKKYHLDIQEEQLKASVRPGGDGYGKEPSDRYGVLTSYKDGALTSEVVATVEPPTYVDYYRRFAKALAGGGDVPVSASEASDVIRLIELAKESSRLGKTLDV
ncbi:hypothetical protein AJ79_06277 [Helicocarpus griseus UAMH5409]|uniref:Oxidoreductase n=1 Tax=Helicocarpus griseus UAMH5409 TaxID=1447875 RepID=A0A2B7XFN1_9EURO|nr:hypothetical protein AJ79_06277 [Helicocarpus griseus UAMH5409]